MAERRRRARRAEDIAKQPWEPRNRAVRALWAARRDIWNLLLTIFVVGALLLILEEGRERADGQCLIFEGGHLQEVNDLGNAYDYFDRITPEDYNDPTFKFGLGRLPEIEEAAYMDPAPEYCDDKGVGLPEPDPPIPMRPPSLERFTKPPFNLAPPPIPPKGVQLVTPDAER